MARSIATFGKRVAAAWHVWVPIVILLAFCAPRVGQLLPAAADHADEIYQPLQTMRFFASLGQQFDKYGPTSNFLLAPAYGVTLAYYKLTGQYGRPSGDWPYGFADPIRQLGTLILETRVISLLLAAAMVGIVSDAFARATRDRAVALLVTLLFVVGDYGVTWNAPFARPDSAMIAFLGMSLAIALRIATEGPTRWRSLGLAFCSAMSVGAKENAGPVLAATVLATYFYCWHVARGDEERRRLVVRQLITTIIAGTAIYVATNVLYAPKTWWQRVDYWLFGEGLSGEVWSRSASKLGHSRDLLLATWNNLGPAGAIVAPISLIAAAIARPKLSLLLWLPALICFAVVFKIPYVTDRFVLPAALALAFPAAIGVAALATGRGRAVTLVLCAIAAFVNLWWTTITWHMAATNDQSMVERAMASEDPKTLKAYALMFAYSTPSRRMAYLGHNVDPRSMQDWIDPTRPRPEIVYANHGRIQMIEEAARMPGRASYYENLSGFKLSAWPGMSNLGYGKPEPFVVPLPAYLRPFKFMPLMSGELRHRSLLVYRQQHASSTTMPVADQGR